MKSRLPGLQVYAHAGECVEALPNVIQAQRKPWINIDNASTQELLAQIAKCPSGALSVRQNEK